MDDNDSPSPVAQLAWQDGHYKCFCREGPLLVRVVTLALGNTVIERGQCMVCQGIVAKWIRANSEE